MGRRRAALAALPLLLAAACSAGSHGRPTTAPASVPVTASTASTPRQSTHTSSPTWSDTGLPTTAPTLSPTTTYAPKPVAISPDRRALATFDWLHPTSLGIAGWTLRSCDDGRLGICVEHAGASVGTVTIDVVALDVRPGIRAIYTTKGAAAALRVVAGRYLDEEQAARARTCGAGYQFTRSARSSFIVRGSYVLSYGYVGRTRTGRSDMAIRYAGIRDNRLTVIGASSWETGSCGPPSAQAFASKTLAAFLPVLDAVVRAVAFP